MDNTPRLPTPRPLRWLLLLLLVAAAGFLILRFSARLASPQAALQAAGAQLSEPRPLSSTTIAPTTERPGSQGSGPVIPGEPPPTALPRTATPLPLEFVFPTPRSAPVSAWRPPVYPVPWAPTPYDHFYFIRPIPADEVNWPTPDYRYGGIFFTGITHSGVDIVAEEGAPVLAAADGKIAWAGYGLNTGPDGLNDPYGISVVIRHDFGFGEQLLYTLYAHLSQADVLTGQYVRAGEQIGRVGETGFATGPHLHFEVRLRENFLHTTLNPELWISPPQGWGVLAGRVTDASGALLLGQSVWIVSQDSGKTWLLRTYGSRLDVNSDPYYRENLVMGDLPAGRYTVQIPYQGANWDWQVEIRPGRVTFFAFRGRNGYFDTPPPTPVIGFTPPAAP